MAGGWIGVDLDGTLAEYNNFEGITIIGRPIPRMVDRVKRWLQEGKKVKVFTARVSGKHNPQDVELARKAIQAWCGTHIGVVLEVTNEKDWAMWQLWDDRAVQVIPNTGLRADGERE